MTETDVGRFPNIINKKKLTPLPLLRHNLSPARSFTLTPKPVIGFGLNNYRSAAIFPSSTVSAQTKFMSELKTVNNYGRLCDQPFLEYSSFHLQQVFGAGNGKKKIVLAPLQQRKGKNQLMTRVRQAEQERRRSSALIKVPETLEEPSVELTKQESQFAKINRTQEEDEENVEDGNVQLNNQTVIRKMYNIDKHEIVIGFVTLEVVLTKANGAPGMSVSTYLGTNDLKKIYLNSDEEISIAIINSLIYKDGDLKIKIKDNSTPIADAADDDEPYPEKKENIPVTLGGQQFNATILFPYLEISIAGLNYKEKQPLKPRYLANLYDANFENLEDYIRRFSLPPQVFKSQADIIDDELRALPTIVKKVIRQGDFGGLMLFKSLEVHLRNTSDVKPQISTADHPNLATPRTRHLMKNRKKDVDKVLLRLNFADMKKLSRCTADEIVELIKTSIQVEEGKGFKIDFEEEQIAPYVHRHEFDADSFPEFSQKFTIRFNKFLYEAFIKFPTLELYVPETNYKNVVQMTPQLIDETLKDACSTMEKHLPLFHVPELEHQVRAVQELHKPASPQIQVTAPEQKESEQKEVEEATVNQEEKAFTFDVEEVAQEKDQSNNEQ